MLAPKTVKQDATSVKALAHRHHRLTLNRSVGGRDVSAVDALVTSVRSAQIVSRPASQAKVLMTREGLPPNRRSRTLDELFLEVEQLSHERESSLQHSDNEEETCLLLHEPGKAIIDTGCGRCVIGAETLEAHKSVMGCQAKEIVWQPDAPSVVFYYGKATKDRSLGVIDLSCVVGGQHMQIRMYVVPGEVPCLLSKGWLKEHGAVLNTSSEELVLTKQQITAPM